MNTLTDIQFTDKDVDRFVAKVAMTDNVCDCWTWTGARHSKTRGYGKFRIGEHVYNAHRVSYVMFNGDLEDGQVVGHKCNNESCVNPHHLEAQTQTENMQYCVACGRHNLTK